MTQAAYRGSPFAHDVSGSAPLVTLFERDDAIAVPLLSQLRMAGYDVRASRTPVELFDTLSKSLVSLVLVDLGAATAGRREFWVALDAQRRGRAIQVMTFRLITPHGDLDLDNEPSARAVADVEARGVHEFGRIIDGVRQRVPLHGAPAGQGVPGMAGMQGMPAMGGYAPGGIQPLGAALGMAPTPFSAQNSHLFNAPPGPPTATPASWGGIAPLGVSSLIEQPGAYGAYGPVNPVPPIPQAPSMGQMGQMGQMGPTPPQVSATMETTPFDPARPVGMPGMPGSPSPFASPTPSNPFGPGSSRFAQPYDSNPFGGQSAALRGQAGQPPSPSSQPPAAPGRAAGYAPPGSPWDAAPLRGPAGPTPPAPSTPSSYPPNYPPGFPPSFPPSAPSSVPPWGVSGHVNTGSDPSFGHGYGGYDGYDATPFSAHDPQNFHDPYAAHDMPSPPAFQDAWSPPDSDGYDPAFEQTGVAPEISFQRHMPSDAWETQRGPVPALPVSPAPHAPSARIAEPNYIAPRSQLDARAGARPDPAEDGPTRAMMISTPTETALGGVLVDGALLTPGKLEALKGIQAMLAGVNIHRKLGDLALMFKFLSPDQLLAALLVSRGLVSPQQIASLGRVKQELAASGVENDLETLLLSFHILPADQLRKIRAELAS